MSILLPTVLIGILGVAFGYMLAWFAQKFAVHTNPLIKKIEEILPGANCGACGYPGCSGLAEKIVNEDAPVNACPVGGVKVWTEIAKLTGKTTGKLETKKAMLVCQGGKGTVQELGTYFGIDDCRAAAVLGVSHIGCINGCLGLGTCEKICPFDAIHINPETSLPVIDWAECTGCGKCVEEWSKKNIENLNRQWGNLANRMGTLVEDIFFPSMDQTIEKYFHIRCDILERNKRIRRDDKSLEIDIMAILKKAKQAFIVEVKSNPDRTEYIEGFLEKLDKITQFLPELEEYTFIGIYAGLDMSKETVHLLTKKRIYAMVFKGDILEIVNYEEFSGVRS
jgi:Na+-translocating ferredoxin:NAD+ oxidoreductase RNF subunit RnfB